MHEKRAIYAQFTDTIVRVYQAYNDRIADEALQLGTFGKLLKLERMTWIKPSFLWMMYRSGWGTKENQNRILAIDISREGFEEILSNVVLSTYDPHIYSDHENWRLQLQNSEVRCQFDPDRDMYGNPINRRAIQLGLKGSMVKRYIHEWIVNITDISPNVKTWKGQIAENTFDEKVLPTEQLYPVSDDIKRRLGME